MLRPCEKHCQRLFRIIAGHSIRFGNVFPPAKVDLAMPNTATHKAPSHSHFPVRVNLFAAAFIRYHGCDSMATDQPPWSFR